MEWDRRVTRGQLVQGGARAAIAGSLLGGVDLVARAGEAFAAGRRRRRPTFRLAARPAPAEAHRSPPRQDGARQSLPRAVVGAGPARCADRRLGGRAGVVPPDDAANGNELPHRRLPRQAGADLVGRQGDERPRHRHARDPRRQLSRDRPRSGRRRPAVGPARVPDHAREHRAPHELRGSRRRPDVCRRPAERQGDRRDGAGDRVAERPRALRVEEPRPRRHLRDTRAVHGSSARLLPHQLDRPHPDGGLLVSARNTWAVYKISRRTGEVRWRLGGKKSDFTMGKGTVFAWQHDARHQGHNRITIFDDGAQPQVEPQSRGLVIELDQKTRTRAARAQVRPSAEPDRVALHGEHAGARQRQRDDRLGQRAVLHRVRPDGEIALDVRLPDGGRTTARSGCRGTGGRHCRRRPSTASRTGGARCTCRGTARPRWRRGGSTLGRGRARFAPAAPSRARASRPRSARRPATSTRRAVALDASGHALGRSKTLRDLDQAQQPERRHADGDRERELACPPRDDSRERRGCDPDPAFAARALAVTASRARRTRRSGRSAGSAARTAAAASARAGRRAATRTSRASIPRHVGQKLIA